MNAGAAYQRRQGSWAQKREGNIHVAWLHPVRFRPPLCVQAKDLLARYGSAYLITSISFAIVSFAACYAAVDAGLDVAALLQRFGLQVRGSCVAGRNCRLLVMLTSCTTCVARCWATARELLL